MINEIPRRNRMDQWTAAERAVFDAVQVVEAAGADVRLTDAVILLQAARDSVADFIDGIDKRRYVRTPTDTAQKLAERITDYLGNGGFFNPELMEHDQVRDLLIDCRDFLRTVP